MKNIKIIIGYRSLNRVGFPYRENLIYHITLHVLRHLEWWHSSNLLHHAKSCAHHQTINRKFWIISISGKTSHRVSDLHYLLLSNIHNDPISFLICNSFLFLFCHFRTANNQLRDRFFHSGLTRHDELLINGNKRKQDMIIKSNMF